MTGADEKTSTDNAEPEKETEAEKEEPKSPTDFRLYWNNGLRFETADKAFSFRFGGRIQNDWAFASGDDDVEAAVGDLVGGTEFRRARLYVQGTVHRRVEFKTQFDFAGGNVVFKDVYIGVTKLPGLGGIRIGHFKEPFSLEELTSSKYITFLERSLPSIFYPSRNTGLMVHNRVAGQRASWALGVFKEVGGSGNVANEDDYIFTARITGLPWFKEGGRYMLHLGGSYSFRSPNEDQIRYRQRPEVHLSPRFVDTKTFEADSVNLFDLEVSLVAGPLSAQGEYLTSLVDAPDAGDPAFRAFYLQASYFLTGENRAYSRSSAAFSRVKVRKNLGADGGAGAWEVAVRYSKLDLEEEGVTGGELSDVTVGLNWHLNPVTRFMFNYVFADRDALGEANFFQMRFQIDF
ncbi:MAG: OprO/OprP family phosphate-selective porin [Acidobacteriota bacterium]